MKNNIVAALRVFLLPFATLLLAFGPNSDRLTAAPPRAVTPPSKPLLEIAARAVGINRCLPAISSVAERVTQGSILQDIMLDWDRQAPDDGPMFSVTALGAGSERAVISVTAVPPAQPANTCSILVERISATPQACSAVAASTLAGLSGGQLIDSVMVYQNPTKPGETYTLVSSTHGCLVIRRQAAYNVGLR